MHLVIGASGQVGGALLLELERRKLICLGTYHNHKAPVGNFEKLDLSHAEDVAALVARTRPLYIYVPASYTNVDGCEDDPDKSFAVNVRGVQAIAAAAHQHRAKLIYFSSDYVFDGTSGPYDELAPVSPISVYGRHKVEAEQAAMKETEDAALIVRTTVVFGPEWQQKNFVLRLIKQLSEGREVPVPDDQIGTPTFNRDLAHSTVELALGDQTGIFNVAGEDLCSRYELAMAVAETFELDEELIIPVQTEMLAQKAKRPLKAGLKVDKVKEVLARNARVTGFREALEELHREIDELESAGGED
ncbi:MAG: SDR family oxidoreductase [Cyanobacteria bacterium SZAS LIN-3]|nr:SDR family oxidoreductase [Cyanobacteria bacterium SZAS LIN-3]